MRIVTDYKHAQQIIVELDAEIERLTAEVTELKVALAVSKHETGTVDNALYKYEVLWSNCVGWRESDWPEWFCRRTADAVVENAKRVFDSIRPSAAIKALEGEVK